MNKQVLYIIHDIEEFLRSTGRVSACDVVYTEKLNRREKDILSVLKKRNIASRQVPEREFKKIAAETFSGDIPKHLRHILLFCPAALLQSSKPLSALWPLVDGLKHSVILILAGITDPHNLGAIIRNADIFEASAVILPKRRSAVMNETARRVSAGAGHHVRVFTVANIVRIIEQLKEREFWVYGTDVQGRNLNEVKLTGRIALVMGNEERGIPHEIRRHLDEILTIPTGGHIDSCNVSVASGIFLYEIRRQN